MSSEPTHSSKDMAEAAPKDHIPKIGRPRRNNKREVVLKKAAELIARQGFDGTSMRDIAAAVNMLPGSLYYHFPSKEEMLLAIHERVVGDMTAEVQRAIDKGSDPWDRLERAAVAHLKGLLGSGNLVSIISPNFAEDREAVNEQLKAQRRSYEQIFRDLFADLDITPGTERGLLRLQLLGALNWVPVWYKADQKMSPAKIAKTFVRSIRKEAQT
ncbi:TetR/AcrR family transcriptional regulator [uncultured Sulfitobacter sp.]|uniref:TetR/AcrR family transcriptional regulator n=1 Tax=Sulfitobacter sp. SH22 TaxID=3421172 RepID=UPI0025D0C9BC|nr:TetR/AcrR family transcriptional regulator [uncultured Sulfitobacter sp.]